MRNVSSVVTVKSRWLIGRSPLRTIVSTAPTATTITLHHAVTSADISSVQVSYYVSFIRYRNLKVPTFIYHHLQRNLNSSGFQFKVVY